MFKPQRNSFNKNTIRNWLERAGELWNKVK